MGNGIALAIKKVFKNVAAFICYYHFLKSVGKDLFGDGNNIIRKRLQKHGIQAVLKRRARRLEDSIADTNTLVDGFVSGIESDNIPSNCPLSHVPEITAYTLINGDLTIADAICDRIIYSSLRIELKGGRSVRKIYANHAIEKEGKGE